MPFHTIQFTQFFAVVYGVYLLIPHKWQNLLLLAASYYFYSRWSWGFASVLALLTALNYAFGAIIGSAPSDPLKKRALRLCVGLNVAVLVLYKYFGLLPQVEGSLAILVPVGLSFYTLQLLTYPIEIRRGTMKPTRDWAAFALFGAFFPTVIAGPVERAPWLLPQILAPRKVTRQAVHEGAWLIFWGLYKKILLADNLAKLTKPVFENPGAHDGTTVAVAAYAFAFQVYADFSGYSDIARGVARLMGFEIMRNFRAPFFASNLADLWQRWHASLTTWIRDYVYYPLGLKKCGGRSLPAWSALLATWILFGLWHSLEWRFFWWGVYHGLLLVGYHAIRPSLSRMGPFRESRVWKTVSTLVVFHLFTAGLLFFAADSTGTALKALQVILTGGTVVETPNWAALGLLAVFIVPVFVIDKGIDRTDDDWTLFRWHPVVRALLYYALFYLIVHYGVFVAKHYYYVRF